MFPNIIIKSLFPISCFICLGLNPYNTISRKLLSVRYIRYISENLPEQIPDVSYCNVNNDTTESLQDKSIQNKLKDEWKELESDTNREWLNLTVENCQSFIDQYDSIPDIVNKMDGWCNLVQILCNFRKAQVNMQNASLNAFLDTVKEKRLQEYNEELNEDEQNEWNNLKKKKMEDDQEWKTYQLITWKYWNLAQLPTDNETNVEQNLIK
ncbi:ring-exported protein 4, putative [Plasmodium ovale]|uniref:Ring-exported protein 4, putative n=2 Tax=Plasmodium ovale TaxID=36330 RepID=A0A1A8WIV6_PLAOA|nr:ring-exported protein 4, putative [Plasmodium ovale curtisi]SBS98841.1 ring-exported protein 4, putative [Plasmodium ovale curtisi]SBT83547.1 ring-exported protein 4, putative [Plasmodium ovale]